MQVHLISKARRFGGPFAPLQAAVLGQQGRQGLGGEAAAGQIVQADI